MVAEQPHEAPVAKSVDVNFGGGRLQTDRSRPQGREQGTLLAFAQAIGALAAHPGEGGGFDDAAGADKRIEEAELALGRPAVVPNLAASE